MSYFNPYANGYMYASDPASYGAYFMDPSMQMQAWAAQPAAYTLDPSCYGTSYPAATESPAPPPTQYYTEKYIDKNNVLNPPKRTLTEITTVPLPKEPYPDEACSKSSASSAAARSEARSCSAKSKPSSSTDLALSSLSYLTKEKNPARKEEKSDEVLRQTKSASSFSDSVTVKAVQNFVPVKPEPSSNFSNQKHRPRPNPEKQPAAYRFKPYPAGSRPDDDDEPLPTFRLAPDRDILVVDSKSASTPGAGVINLRKPGVRDGSGNYSAVPSNLPPGKYDSTVSNRLGLTGPDSLQRTHNQEAHSQGIGKYLLQKMGWAPGTGLGANPGDVVPLGARLDTKLDKKGLGTTLGVPVKLVKKSGQIYDQSVGYLNEVCFSNHWKFPVYTLIDDSGPPHCRSFLYKVVLNGQEYSENEPGSTKKGAKNIAARWVLRDLGVLRDTAEEDEM